TDIWKEVTKATSNNTEDKKVVELLQNTRFKDFRDLIVVCTDLLVYFKDVSFSRTFYPLLQHYIKVLLVLIFFCHIMFIVISFTILPPPFFFFLKKNIVNPQTTLDALLKTTTWGDAPTANAHSLHHLYVQCLRDNPTLCAQVCPSVHLHSFIYLFYFIFFTSKTVLFDWLKQSDMIFSNKLSQGTFLFVFSKQTYTYIYMYIFLENPYLMVDLVSALCSSKSCCDKCFVTFSQMRVCKLPIPVKKLAWTSELKQGEEYDLKVEIIVEEVLLIPEYSSFVIGGCNEMPVAANDQSHTQRPIIAWFDVKWNGWVWLVGVLHCIVNDANGTLRSNPSLHFMCPSSNFDQGSSFVSLLQLLVLCLRNGTNTYYEIAESIDDVMAFEHMKDVHSRKRWTKTHVPFRTSLPQLAFQILKYTWTSNLSWLVPQRSTHAPVVPLETKKLSCYMLQIDLFEFSSLYFFISFISLFVCLFVVYYSNWTRQALKQLMLALDLVELVAKHDPLNFCVKLHELESDSSLLGTGDLRGHPSSSSSSFSLVHGNNKRANDLTKNYLLRMFELVLTHLQQAHPRAEATYPHWSALPMPNLFRSNPALDTTLLMEASSSPASQLILPSPQRNGSMSLLSPTSQQRHQHQQPQGQPQRQTHGQASMQMRSLTKSAVNDGGIHAMAEEKQWSAIQAQVKSFQYLSQSFEHIVRIITTLFQHRELWHNATWKVDLRDYLLFFLRSLPSLRGLETFVTGNLTMYIYIYIYIYIYNTYIYIYIYIYVICVCKINRKTSFTLYESVVQCLSCIAASPHSYFSTCYNDEGVKE
ncbi:hypothetical protein RFI_18830, partial [Reticulomyxa filosa]